MKPFPLYLHFSEQGKIVQYPRRFSKTIEFESATIFSKFGFYVFNFHFGSESSIVEFHSDGILGFEFRGSWKKKKKKTLAGPIGRI